MTCYNFQKTHKSAEKSTYICAVLQLIESNGRKHGPFVQLSLCWWFLWVRPTFFVKFFFNIRKVDVDAISLSVR